MNRKVFAPLLGLALLAAPGGLRRRRPHPPRRRRRQQLDGRRRRRAADRHARRPAAQPRARHPAGRQPLRLQRRVQHRPPTPSPAPSPTPVGTFSGKTDDFGDTALIPAFGWVHHTRGSNFAYGIGFLGLAGFGTDYPQDSTNPILSPQPQRLRPGLLQLPAPEGADGARLEAQRPAFSFGISLNAARATLEADPAGFASPDCSGPQGPCYFPHVNGDSAWGYGAGVGIQYKLTPTFALGASYNSKTKFQDFVWHSAVANPGLPTYGTSRKISLAARPARAGRRRPRLDPHRPASPWPSTRSGSTTRTPPASRTSSASRTSRSSEIGLQYKATDKLALRAGYNHSRGRRSRPRGPSSPSRCRRSSSTTTASASASTPPTS